MMKNMLVGLMGLALSGCVGLSRPGVFDVRDYGAKGDGVVKDTAAIQAAIDAAHDAGGGEVFLGAGTYLSGSIFLKSNVDFHLGAGATLLGSPDKEDYNALDVCPQNSASKNESSFGAHLILCLEQENVTVRGPGKIDGNSSKFLLNPETGKVWGYNPRWQWAGQGVIPWRPSQMLYFVESRNLRIQDLELKDSTYWSCFLFGCEQVAVRGLYIHNERRKFHTHNGDGIDIDCCQHVTVSDCRIDTADDCITLRANVDPLKKKRDCAYITVDNCTLSTPCNCVRVGVGQGRVHDAVFSNITVEGARTAVNFVSAWSAKSTKGVDFRNIRFMNWTVDCRILLHMYGGGLAPGVTRQAEFDGVSLVGFSGTAPDICQIKGLPNMPFRNILLRDIDVPTVVRVENAENVKVDGGQLKAIFPDHVFEARAFGAKGDGVAKDTAAIQKAIDTASAAGGGTVRLAKGTYLSGTLYLKNDVDFCVDEGATLKASPDRADYCAADAFPQNYASKYDNTSGGHLLVAVGCTNVTVRGPGVIDGNAAAFLVDPKTGRQYEGWKKGIPWRPGQMIYIVDSKYVRLDGANLRNSPYWSCFLLNCDTVTVRACTIRTERERFRTWNGDGLDIDRCSNVYVANCDFDTEDDSITLRASTANRLAAPQDCHNVRVTQCRFSSACNAIRVGVGEGVIRDCHLSKLGIDKTRKAICLVSAYSKGSRGVDIRNVTFEDIDVDCETCVDLGYRHATASEIRDITFRDIRGMAKKPNLIENKRAFENIVFDGYRVKEAK